MSQATHWRILSRRLYQHIGVRKNTKCYQSTCPQTVKKQESKETAPETERSLKNDNSSVNPSTQEIKPFEKIPGPFSFPMFGTIIYYLFGIYRMNRLHHSGLRKYKKYGPLVREEMLPGLNVLWVFDPDDIETIFRAETGFPERRSHLAILKFRKDRPHVYNSGGLLPSSGEDWWKLRKEFQKGLSAPKCVRTYLPATDKVIHHFVQSRLQYRHEDMLPELSRLFLDLTCLVAFDTNMNSFSHEEMKPDSRSSRLMEAAENVNSCILTLDNHSLSWEKKETRLYKHFKTGMLYLEEVAVDLVEKKIRQMASATRSEEVENEVPSLLEQYLSSSVVDKKDVIGMAVDMLLAGIDTTAYTASFALYHIAKNPRVQVELQHEARKLLGPSCSNVPITQAILAEAPYTRAVLKEVFRMNPVSVGVGRRTSQDLVLSGYHVPAQTVVVTQNQVMCRFKKYFREPNFFIPERWLKGHSLQMVGSPYLVLPFGHGARSCIARRLAEQHLLTLILRIAHNYQLHWEGDANLDCMSLLINKPDLPIKVAVAPLNKAHTSR